jgi:hypothetical protein
MLLPIFIHFSKRLFSKFSLTFVHISNQPATQCKQMIHLLLCGCFILSSCHTGYAQKNTGSHIEQSFHSIPLKFQNGKGYQPILHKETVVMAKGHSLLNRAANWFINDVKSLTGIDLQQATDLPQKGKLLIYIAPLEDDFIQQLLRNKKLAQRPIAQHTESYQMQWVQRPAVGWESALIITGNGPRGTAYGLMDLMRAMGISPWHWWADVPITPQKQIYWHIPTIVFDYPRVTYRGIFINDEAPALAGWSREKFGGFNHRFYEKVFELMVRLKANYIWPAMWGNAFFDDDTANARVAREMAIIIGTSHHEPLMRAHDEWRRYGKGPWNYESNAQNLEIFWKEGLQKAKTEKIITIGMRGDGDEPMSRETATELLEKIVQQQRKIIAEVSGQPADASPQIWALYKEVQDYYDKGMRVPDDVTLLLCDDNWGNIRRLPSPTDQPRRGGYGMYYHFDYVGGPRNYKWLNTNPLPRIWEQMNMAYEHHVRKLWIVNVGDIKPMELPIHFFLDMAWNPEKFQPNKIFPYTVQWAAEQFNKELSTPIAELLAGYTKLSGRRKPELLDENTYSLTAFQEAERTLNTWSELEEKCFAVKKQLPATHHDAFFQLVEHPITALANLQRMYNATAQNHQAALFDPHKADSLGKLALLYYGTGSLLTQKYHSLRNGKWNHMMSQTHIGYTYWQQPPTQVPPTLYLNRRADRNAEQTRRTTTSPQPTDSVWYVALSAESFSENSKGATISWQKIPDLGREGSAMVLLPSNKTAKEIQKEKPTLYYNIPFPKPGTYHLVLYCSPTLNIYKEEKGLLLKLIFQQKEQILSLNENDDQPKYWDQWVANNIIEVKTTLNVSSAGNQTIALEGIHPGWVIQKLVVHQQPLPKSYLGPPANTSSKK